MIQWPEARLSAVARENLERFQETSAAQELEQSADVWTVTSWPWVPALPQRVILRNERFETMEFVREITGLWHMRAGNGSPHVRPMADAEEYSKA